jgi:hypothetical protein
VFDAATEEARRRRAEEMGERWRAERQRVHMERDFQYREWQKAMEQR